MSIDFEDRLRADMARVQVTARPGLAREAHGRFARSRRRTALAVAATGTAAAVAGATAGLTLTAGTSGSSGDAAAGTTGYVVSHVTSALAATNAISYTSARETGAGRFLTDRVIEWALGERTRQLIETSAGQPIVDNSARPDGGRGAIISVHYPARDWMPVTVPASALPGAPAGNTPLCTDNFLSAFAAAKTATSWTRIIRAGLACGMFTVAGRQWVDGVDAIKLAGHPPAAGTAIWVDPRSYLPVRLTGQVQLSVGGTGRQPTGTLTIDFRWLPPTKANLAELTAPIPAGFREVSG